MGNPTKPFPRPTELTVASLSRPLEARALPRRHGEHEDDIPGSGEQFFSTQDTCFSLGKPFPAAARASYREPLIGSGGGAAVSDRAFDSARVLRGRPSTWPLQRGGGADTIREIKNAPPSAKSSVSPSRSYARSLTAAPPPEPLGETSP